MSLSMSIDTHSSTPLPPSTGSSQNGFGTEIRPPTVDRLDGCPVFNKVGQSFVPIGDCSTYTLGVECQYSYQYEGCTWSDLACTAIYFCTCTAPVVNNPIPDEFAHFDPRPFDRPVPPQWECKVFAREACNDDVPDGLPTGECTPNSQYHPHHSSTCTKLY